MNYTTNTTYVAVFTFVKNRFIWLLLAIYALHAPAHTMFLIPIPYFLVNILLSGILNTATKILAEQPL